MPSILETGYGPTYVAKIRRAIRLFRDLGIRPNVQGEVSGKLPVPAEPQKPFVWASIDGNGFSVLRQGEIVPVGFRPVPAQNSQPSQSL